MTNEEAIRFLDMIEKGLPDKSMKVAIRALREHITKQSVWIPVNERLPEENRTVIASTEYVVYPEARYTKEDGWEWAYESGADYWVELTGVKAWIPLPKPFEPQESEDKE